MIVLLLAFVCALTCIFEALALLFFKDKKDWFKPVFICNLLTNPLLNMIYPFLQVLLEQAREYTLSVYLLLVLEVGVVFLEAWLLSFFVEKSYKRRLAVSAVINAVSFIAGVILFAPTTSLFWPITRGWR